MFKEYPHQGLKQSPTTPRNQGKTKGQIKFKYPNDIDWQIFNTDFPPVDYSISEIIYPVPFLESTYQYDFFCAQSDVTLIVPGVGCISSWGVFNFPIKNKTIFAISKSTERIPWCTRNPNITAHRGCYFPQTGNGNYGGSNCASLFSGWSIQGNYHPIATTTGCNSCTFTITDTRGKVYESTSSTCPIIEVICGDTCPPETVCQCDCGANTVCCYSKSGTPIFSYPK